MFCNVVWNIGAKGKSMSQHLKLVVFVQLYKSICGGSYLYFARKHTEIKFLCIWLKVLSVYWVGKIYSSCFITSSNSSISWPSCRGCSCRGPGPLRAVGAICRAGRLHDGPAAGVRLGKRCLGPRRPWGFFLLWRAPPAWGSCEFWVRIPRIQQAGMYWFWIPLI